MKRYTVYDIELANKQAGFHFFGPDTMRFFNSRILNCVYQGDSGIYFVTSEKYDSSSNRFYCVRKFNPKSGNIDTISGMQESLSKYKAIKLAKQLAGSNMVENYD